MTVRKVAAVFVAAMMALTMMVAAAPAKAFAAGAGNLTISSSSAEFDGKEVKAWQMFEAAPSADGMNAGYTLNAAWEGFFKGLDDFADKDKTGAELSDAAITYVLALGGKDAENVVDFAKKASDWAKQNNIDPTSIATAAPSNGKYVASFTGLPYGYYAVSPLAGSTADRGTDAMLVNVLGDQDVELKSEYPTVDKTVDGDNHADAQVGDVLDFALTSKVPDMTEYKTYTFNFVDTLSKGLTLDQASIKVAIGGTVLVQDTDYSVSVVPDGEKTKMTVSMIDFKGLHGDKAGQEIKVTYSATLNENAVVGQDDAGNEVKLEYSNDPATGGTGESVPDITHGYTFGFDLLKTDDAKAPLPGAVFQLQKQADGSIVQLIVVQQGNETDPMIVRPAKPGEAGVGTVTTPASGLITFQGLDAGAYQLVETEAPDGFNKLAQPIDVVIDAQYNQDGTLNSWTVNGQPNADSAADVTVENKKGTLLPETGGMGTVAFTVVGVLAVIAGIVWSIRRKRDVR